MKDTAVIKETVINDPLVEFVPFVNEECGDTMWELVLAEHDLR